MKILNKILPAISMVGVVTPILGMTSCGTTSLNDWYKFKSAVQQHKETSLTVANANKEYFTQTNIKEIIPDDIAYFISSQYSTNTRVKDIKGSINNCVIEVVQYENNDYYLLSAKVKFVVSTYYQIITTGTSTEETTTDFNIDYVKVPFVIINNGGKGYLSTLLKNGAVDTDLISKVSPDWSFTCHKDYLYHKVVRLTDGTLASEIISPTQETYAINKDRIQRLDEFLALAYFKSNYLDLVTITD